MTEVEQILWRVAAIQNDIIEILKEHVGNDSDLFISEKCDEVNDLLYQANEASK